VMQAFSLPFALAGKDACTTIGKEMTDARSPCSSSS